MILVRYILIVLIGYLIIRSFIRYGEQEKSAGGSNSRERTNKPTAKKISKEIGEYVDYEEIKK
jgi:hypothetical protein